MFIERTTKHGQRCLSVEPEDKIQMKQSFRDRIEVLESQRKNTQATEPIIFSNEECGMTMQIIGNGLVVPVPMDEKTWQVMMEKHR